MVLNTISVGAAVAPTVIETYFDHYLNRKPLSRKPTAHISYHEGLRLIRQFLVYASHHTVEDLQAFTSRWVPCPRWVKVDEVTIPEGCMERSADLLIAQLGHKGIDRVGGSNWWQWRRDGTVPKAEWIEMRAHHARRKQAGGRSKRVILYIHGEACTEVGSKSVSAVTRYRLAPQFPFPCGLHDCLAAYLYLLTEQSEATIILAGDSAGGGMITSMLVTLRDQELPLPAGAILISPWVDLTHSFPSLCGDGRSDYIPAHGFLHRPSAAWPPPTVDDMEAIALHAVEKAVGEGLPRRSTQQERQKATQEAVQGFSDAHDRYPTEIFKSPEPEDTIPGPGHELSIMLDAEVVHIKDQIQMYTTNQLLSHPLVSPVLSPSLGGLPPLLILTGGGELLRDEQIYLAHKAANPSGYPPSEAFLDEHPECRDTINKYKPTDVQLQVWDDLCHVAPTLSFTRPAKYMFRSVSQFGAWALARAQKTEIDIMDDDDVSVISSESNTESDSSNMEKPAQTRPKRKTDVAHVRMVAKESVGKAGQPLPPFQNHMIRQRVDRHGTIFPLEPAASMPALQLSPNEIGVIKPGPVRKWLGAKKEWDTKYAKEKRRVQKQRIDEMAKGFQDFGDDDAPPPSALAGRRCLSGTPMEKKLGRSWWMSLWSSWGSKHDEDTMVREQRADTVGENPTATPVGATYEGAPDGLPSPLSDKPHRPSIPRSRDRTVTDTGQSVNADQTPSTALVRHNQTQSAEPTATNGIRTPQKSGTTFDYIGAYKPVATGVQNTPMKLKALRDEDVNASTVALKDYRGLLGPGEQADGQLGGSAGVAVDGQLGGRPVVERFETAKERM